MNRIINRILTQIDCPDLLDRTDYLPLSDINSLLLEIYDRRVANGSVADLLKRYVQSRLSSPSEISPVVSLTLETDVLRFAEQQGMHAILLSPAATLGCSSVLAPVLQKKVLSAVRGVEIISDPTNMLALYLADKLKKGELDNAQGIHICAACRVLRGQVFSGPAQTQHFSLFGMVSSGRDTGSYACECALLVRQIKFCVDFIRSRCGNPISLRLCRRSGYADSAGFLDRMSGVCRSAFPDIPLTIDRFNADNLYYRGLNYKVCIRTDGKDLEICDGGFVPWTQKLLGNRKERLLIGGMGLDRLLYFTS